MTGPLLDLGVLADLVADRLRAELREATSKKSEVMTTEEAAAFLRCNEAEVRKLAGEGVLPGVKVGKGWRFLREDLLVWFREQSRHGQVQQ